MAVAAILDLCLNKTAKLRRMSEITFSYEIHRDNWYYTSFSGGGGHPGFMFEQNRKVKKNVRNYFLIRNSQRQLILHIVLWRKVKNKYFLRWQWRPSWIYARTKSKNKEKVAEMSLACQLHFEKWYNIFFWQIVQKFRPYWYFWQIKNKMAAKGAIKKKIERYHFAKRRPQPNRICGQIAFTHQKIPFAVKDSTTGTDQEISSLSVFERAWTVTNVYV